MAGIPISQLSPASDNTVDATDVIPAARPNVGTIRIPGAAFINNITNAPNGAPLVNAQTYNVNSGYNTTIKSLCSIGGIELQTTTNNVTVDGSYLLSLINTLSSNMQQIGNPPYVEYAFVTNPAAATITLTNNAKNVVPLNNKLIDTGNIATINSNQITLPAGTYNTEIFAQIQSTAPNSNSPLAVIVGVYNTTTSSYVAVSPAVTNSTFSLLEAYNETFVLSNISVLELHVIVGASTSNQGSGTGLADPFVSIGLATWPVTITGVSNQSTLDKRAYIKLWKVG
jgi:hypothetical protein